MHAYIDLANAAIALASAPYTVERNSLFALAQGVIIEAVETPQYVVNKC